MVSELFPSALLHWEDFGPGNGRRILEKYHPSHCTFNDDMQGTGAIALSAVIVATRRIKGEIGNHRVVVFGSGTAGIGFADQIRDLIASEKGISAEKATEQVWCIDKQGLLIEGMDDLRDFQTSYAKPKEVVSSWSEDGQTATGTGYTIGQANNAMLYPGLGLGTIIVKASQITDGMFAAAARAVADLVTDNKEGSPILPLVDDLREVSRTVAKAVARQAIEEGIARNTPDNLSLAIRDGMWEPRYARYQAV